jgi:Zn-dependent metalloprotease
MSSRRPLAPTILPFFILPLLGGCAGEEAAAVITMTIRHQETASTRAGAELGADADAYLRSLDVPLDLGLSGDDGWEVVSISEAGLTGLRVARLQQVRAGVPVFGSQILVRADETTFLGVNGRHTAHLDGFDLEPTLSGDDALAIAEGAVAGGAAGVSFRDESARLVILPRRDLRGADLAWQVEVANGRSGEVEPGRWTYFVAAGDGAVLRSFSTLYTLEQGSGAGGNAKVSRTWSAELDVETDAAAGMYRMETDRIVTRSRELGDEVVVGMLNEMPDPTANDAHGFTEVTLDMLTEWMGRDSIDDNGYLIVSHVHDTDVCPGAPINACFNGDMNYGDGGDAIPFVFGFHPLSGALDVVAHELHHGFTWQHSALVYEGEAGGLNESFSDVAGTAAEFFREGDAADFDVGEDIVKQNALRYMCDPRADRIPLIGGSIDHMDDFTEDMDPHNSSGVGNRAFCLAVARYRASTWGAGVTDAVQHMASVWFEANAGYWSPSSSYVDACQGTVDAARAIGFDAEVTEAIASSWADVGVVCDSFAFVCNDDGACDAEGGETCASCAEDCGACSVDCNFFDRAKCALGIGDCSRCDLPQGCGDGACDGSETDETCAEDCGCAAEPEVCAEMSPAPFGCYCDAQCAEDGDCCADVEEACGG